MSRILVPVDGSEASLRALRHAMQSAGDIVVVNVQARADAPALLLHMTQQDIDKAQHAHGESMLQGARALLEGAGRAYHARVIVGDPAPSIVQCAAAEAADSIVMGTRGMNALGNLALGSVATRVVHLATVPVTLVR
jgi:nucleotide-binding universal stress UspA family protein